MMPTSQAPTESSTAVASAPRARLCPVCDSSDFRALRRRGALTFGRCGSCGLGYVQPLVEDSDPTVAGSQSIRTNEVYNRQMLEMHRLRAQSALPVARARLTYYEQTLGRPPRSMYEV